jgi:hypothetical protein
MSSPVFTPQNYGGMSEANPIPVVEAPLQKKAKKITGKATRRETFIMLRSERKTCARQAWTYLRKNEGRNYLDEKRKNIYQMQVREFYGREFESVAGLEVAPRPPAEELPDRSQAVLSQGGRPGPPPANGQGGFWSSYGGRGKPFPVKSVDSSRSRTFQPASRGKASVSHRREAGRPVEQGRFHAKVSSSRSAPRQRGVKELRSVTEVRDERWRVDGGDAAMVRFATALGMKTKAERGKLASRSQSSRVTVAGHTLVLQKAWVMPTADFLEVGMD